MQGLADSRRSRISPAVRVTGSATLGGNVITRPVGANLLEQDDEWAVQRRYMSLETLAPISNVPTVSFPAAAAWQRLSLLKNAARSHTTRRYTTPVWQ